MVTLPTFATSWRSRSSAFTSYVPGYVCGPYSSMVSKSMKCIIFVRSESTQRACQQNTPYPFSTLNLFRYHPDAQLLDAPRDGVGGLDRFGLLQGSDPAPQVAGSPMDPGGDKAEGG